MPTVTHKIRTTLEMIKIEHTLFALPFAFLGAVLAARGIPTAWQIVWISVAMLGARSTAMAFNRIAGRGAIDSPIPLLRSLLVMLWTAGFDVLYACQDYEFDRREGLYSIPATFGIARSLWISRALHAGAFAALVALYFLTNLGTLAIAGVIATGALLIYQHTLVRAGDLSRLNAAFFTTNAFVSVILLLTFGTATFLRR